VVGGGLGGIVILILTLLINGFLGGNDGATAGLDPSQVGVAGSENPNAFDQCKTGADANANIECRIIGTVNSVQAFWATEAPRSVRQEWQPTKTVLYNGQTRSACGVASNQVGPFYCPLDKRVYIDASFFQILQDQFGSSGGPLAQEYVVAHEYGHALQDQLGLLGRAQQDPQGPQSGGVKIELMADCLGGVWAKHATTVPDEDTNTPFLKPLTTQDIKDALSAASSVGDDRIQQATQGRVNPENWTHGSSEARQRWFLQGYTSGDPNQCNTFAAGAV
jgi:predicted metalloprotease